MDLYVTPLTLVMPWFRTHSAGVVSSNPAHVTIEMSLVRKAKGNHLIKSISLEETQSPVSVFC